MRLYKIRWFLFCLAMSRFPVLFIENTIFFSIELYLHLYPKLTCHNCMCLFLEFSNWFHWLVSPFANCTSFQLFFLYSEIYTHNLNIRLCFYFKNGLTFILHLSFRPKFSHFDFVTVLGKVVTGFALKPEGIWETWQYVKSLL